MKKFFSLLLVCFLLISSLSFGAFASSNESFVSTDLSTWNKIDEHGASYWGFSRTKNNPDMYHCNITSASSVPVSFCYWSDCSNLEAGSKYSLNFLLPTADDYYKATSNSYFKDNAWFSLWKEENYASLTIGFGSYVDGDIQLNSSFPSFTVDYSNINSFIGKNQHVSFTCPDYSGELYCVIFFSFSPKGPNPVIALSNFSLVDNEKSFFAEQFERLTNLILYFDPEGNYTNPFGGSDSPLYYISEYFDNLIDYIYESVESITNTIDSASGMIHIFDLFTQRFSWLLGICVFTLAVLVYCRFIGL